MGTTESEQHSPVLSLRKEDRVQAEARPSGLRPEQKAELKQGWELLGMMEGWSSLRVWTRIRKEMSPAAVLEDEEAQYRIDRRSRLEDDYKEQ